MAELTAVRGPLLDFARSPGEAKLAALLDPSATVSINMRAGTGAELVAALSGLDCAQRAGLTMIGGEGRSVLIAPARTGQPHTRKLIVFSHPEGLVTEIAAYTDDVAAESARGSGPALAGTRAFPTTSPHRALTAQRVLVSASTDALGLAIASAFVAAGASVVFHGRRTAFDLPEATGQATFAYVSADLAEPEGADYLAEQAASALGGPVTVLVNNLGPWDGTPVSQVSPQAWQQALQSGITAQLRLAQLVAPGMREAGRGRIVNITAASTAKRLRLRESRARAPHRSTRRRTGPGDHGQLGSAGADRGERAADELAQPGRGAGDARAHPARPLRDPRRARAGDRHDHHQRGARHDDRREHSARRRLPARL
jgi:hypothetical protein